MKASLSRTTILKLTSLLLACFFTLPSCQSTTNRFHEVAQKRHPASELFLSYEKEVTLGREATDLLQYYSPPIRKKIPELYGWSQWAYTSVHLALKNGVCQRITLIELSRKKVKLDCVGSYNNTSFIGNKTTQEKMWLRVFFVKVDGLWYLDTNGFKQTKPSSKTTLDRGIKFTVEE